MSFNSINASKKQLNHQDNILDDGGIKNSSMNSKN